MLRAITCRQTIPYNSRSHVTKSSMRIFMRPSQKSFESRLTESSEQFARKLGLKVITGPISLSDPEVKRKFTKGHKPVTPEAMAQNYNVLEISAKNGPSW